MNEKNSSVSVSKTYLTVQFDDNPWSCGLSRGRQFSCSNYFIDISEIDVQYTVLGWSDLVLLGNFLKTDTLLPNSYNVMSPIPKYLRICLHAQRIRDKKSQRP